MGPDVRNDLSGDGERGGQVSQTLQAFYGMLGSSNIMAYLAMMAPRLVELHRVLKPTGSIYLHCDPTASHYLKTLMDAVFGIGNFKNEIIWKRTTAHSDPNRFGRIHDTILFYTKDNGAIWNNVYVPYDNEYIETYYRYVDESGRRFLSRDLTAPAHGSDSGQYEWKGKRPSAGRMWAYTKENMEEMERQGRIFYTKNGFPRLKQFLDEMPGIPAQSIWTDILNLRSWHEERLGYPTQKPEALLERIIEASSNEGHIVLDPFCGCGTAIVVAQKLNRKWIGIDITQAAIKTIKKRLSDSFPNNLKYETIGEPTTLTDAQVLAEQDPFQFQWWALGLVDARPAEGKKGADKGIDGRLYFHDDNSGRTKQIIFSVKAGHTGVSHVRDLRGVLDREKAEIGVLITMQDTTQPMRTEAASAGFYNSAWGKHPRIQLLPIEDLLNGKTIDYPRATGANVTFEKAPKSENKAQGKQASLDL